MEEGAKGEDRDSGVEGRDRETRGLKEKDKGQRGRQRG